MKHPGKIRVFGYFHHSATYGIAKFQQNPIKLIDIVATFTVVVDLKTKLPVSAISFGEININMQTLLQVDYQLITPGRLFSIVAALMGLTSVIIGALAL